MRSLRAALAACVAASALLAGCSDDEPSPSDPTSTWTPTSRPETPSSSATAKPTEPSLPDAATKATEAGARAFITYYFDLISFAQVSGNVRALRKVSGPNCGGCGAGIDGVKNHYEEGGRIVGGALVPSIDRIARVSTRSGSLFGFRADVTTTHSEQTVIGSDGSSDLRLEGKDRWELYLLWRAGKGWRLDVMEHK